MNQSPPKLQGVASNVAAFIGVGPLASPARLVHSLGDYQKLGATDASPFMNGAVKGFFENGGSSCYVTFAPAHDLKTALAALEKEKLALLACPDQESFAGAAKFLAAHCEKLGDRLCVLHAAEPVVESITHRPPLQSSFAAYYHPWVEVQDGARQLSVPPDGHILGALAHADATKVSAQTGAALLGVKVLSQSIDSVEAGALDAQGVNVLRFFAGKGNLVWGGRTTSTDPDWKYVGVRRLAIFVEQSIKNGLQWAVFEPNGPALWANVRQTITDFLLEIWHKGNLQGSKPQDAFLVRCDASTMTAAELAAGNLVLTVGFAPLKPAEFVILRIDQFVKPGRS